MVARPELRLGDEGQWVVVLQQGLARHGHSLEADGDFGPVTEAAVREFQEVHGLAPTGVVDQDTWAALDSPVPEPSSTTDPAPSQSAGVQLGQILEPLEAELSAGSSFTSYRLDCALLTGEKHPDWPAWEWIEVDRDRLVTRGQVLNCMGVTEPGADIGNWYLIALDDRGTITWWAIGTGGADLPYAPPGLLCREYMATDEFEQAMQTMAAWSSDLLAYQWALAYWFLEGAPDRMDVDRNGIPCELLFDPDVVAEVWGTSTAASNDSILFGPAPPLLDASPADQIPWDQVGGDWLALDHPEHPYTDPATLDQRGLYLIAPDDRIYAVSALPSDGSDVVAVSWSGRVALLRGPYAQGLPLGVLDLVTTTYCTIVTSSDQLDFVTLTRDGQGLWVYDVPWSNPREPDGSMRLSHVSFVDGSWSTILEEPVDLTQLSEYYHWWVNNRGGIVELPNGNIATALPSGVWIGTPDGTGFRRLDTPDAECSVVDAWDDAHIVVRCHVPGPEWCDCGPSGLWLVPVNGQPSTEIALPEAGACISYSSATPLEGHLAISAGFGSGECNAHVVLIDPHGAVEQWVATVGEVRCNERVLGVRDDAWLMVAGNPYIESSPSALFEVTTTSTDLIDIPEGRVGPLHP